ncbi:hypothetical protein [Propionibacterium australiense]|uniref:Uncharacterized protein n=1 Tax=Propionibacterium australiense TaxID=119981 RepID=A0A8B3FTE0_9ACTN|nr:hypothetical protein [Propionibacterium australiense]RLP07014.1 hypothetical protein D9T14_11045 [Propionibacterium australiense]RLP10825.1 hypothetical protein D7U36_05980 [Propionibacterium australiense]
MEVVPSAHKHGVDEADMLHAIRMAIRAHRMDGYVMYVGPARDGRLIEVACNLDGEIFHAMEARKRWL